MMPPVNTCGEVLVEEVDPEQQFVMDLLEPYFAPITRVYEAAIALYNSDVSPRARADHDNRAALSAIYRHAWKGLEREFVEEPGFHFLTVRNLHLLNIRDLVVGRTKRVNSNGRHVNNDTQQQRDFDRQLALPGIPPAAIRVVIGYELDLAMSKVERVIVRRPSPAGRWVSQIVHVDGAYTWEDITPAELPLRAGGARG
jgi:hypothetical protein